MNKPQRTPTVYRGHVVYFTYKQGKRLVKVMVDDDGPCYKQTFWVDQNSTPDWLGPRMEVTFCLVPIGPSKSGGNRTRVAIEVEPQE